MGEIQSDPRLADQVNGLNLLPVSALNSPGRLYLILTSVCDILSVRATAAERRRSGTFSGPGGRSCWRKRSRGTGRPGCAAWRSWTGHRSSQTAPAAGPTCSRTRPEPPWTPCCTPQRTTAGRETRGQRLTQRKRLREKDKKKKDFLLEKSIHPSTHPSSHVLNQSIKKKKKLLKTKWEGLIKFLHLFF